MSGRTSLDLVRRAVGAAAALAVVAVVLMGAGTALALDDVGRAGLGALVMVPVARNLVIVIWGGGRERVLAAVGAGLVVVVVAAALLARYQGS